MQNKKNKAYLDYLLKICVMILHGVGGKKQEDSLRQLLNLIFVWSCRIVQGLKSQLSI